MRDNKGRFIKGYKIPEEFREKLSMAKKKRKERLGYINSPETRQKISKIMKDKWMNEETTKKQRDNFIISQRGKMLGKHQSEEMKRKVSETHKRNKHVFNKEAREKVKKWRKNYIFPVKDTKPEIKIQNFLKELQIEFFTHQYINIEHGYQCDIFIPSKNTIIECFGDYWHKIPYGNSLDSLRCKELRDKGYRVLVFWEREIKVMELNDLKKEII